MAALASSWYGRRIGLSGTSASLASSASKSRDSSLVERVRRVEPGDLAGEVQLAAHIVEADDLPVGGVQERHAILPLVLRLLVDAARVALGLVEDFLRADRELLGLDDPADLTAITEGVVGRAAGRGVLADGSSFGELALADRPEGLGCPARRLEPGIDPPDPRLTLAFAAHGGHPRRACRLWRRRTCVR